MAIVITQKANNFDTADQASYTKTVNVGAGGAERAFIIDVGARNATAVSSVTVNTVLATEIDQASRTDTGSNVTGKYVISADDLPDETAEDLTIVTTFNTTAARFAYSVSAMTGHASLVPHDVAIAEIPGNGAAGPLDVPLPITIPAGGALSAVACAADNTTPLTSFAWTNATEHTDFGTGGENFRMSTAFDVDLSAETDRAVNARYTGSAGIFSPVGVAASFTPAAAGFQAALNVNANGVL